MHLDINEFEEKLNHVIDDIEKKKITSKSWIWIASGAIVGLMASCIKINKKKELR